jgi:hypothetical protein
MKAFLILVIAILIAWLVVSTSNHRRQLAQYEKSIAENSEKLKAIEDTPSLELQSKCASAAAEFYARSGYTAKDSADYSNHYNSKLKKCFVMIKANDMKTAPGTMYVTMTVADAVEGKTYGQYMWKSDKVKKYWEVPPIMCQGTAIDGSEKTCKSQEEFAALMSGYMDISD